MDLKITINMDKKTIEWIDRLSNALIGINHVSEIGETLKNLTVSDINVDATEEPKEKQIVPVVEEPVAKETTKSEPEPKAVPVDGSKGYTLDELSKAAANMADTKDKKFALIELLKTKYGTPTMGGLDTARYGEFATDIRAMGAVI